MIVATQAKALVPVLGHRVGGHRDDGAGEFAGAELADGLVAVEHRHLHVHDHGIDGPARPRRVANLLEGFLAVASRHDLGTGAAEPQADELPVCVVIVGQQDPGVQPGRDGGGIAGRCNFAGYVRPRGWSLLLRRGHLERQRQERRRTRIPAMLCTMTSPPSCRASRWQIARPSPVPRGPSRCSDLTR